MENNLIIKNENISNSTINNYVTQVIGNSYQYNDLLDQLKTQQEIFDLLPEDKQERRLETSAKINELDNRIKQFKDDVLRLAEQFQRIEINTDRLKRAKEHFDKGEIGEARAVLESELEQMTDENKRLIQERERFEQEIKPKLINNSNEFLILALSTKTNYVNPNWFKDTCNYFELSINAFSTKDNIFEYAVFLSQHNKPIESELYYQRYLADFSNELSIPQIVMTLNNLGILYKTNNEFHKAFGVYEEALDIINDLGENKYSDFLPDIARILDNLANLHARFNNFDKALTVCKESLKIYQNLADKNPLIYLHDLSITLGNLARHYKNINEIDKAFTKYEESISKFHILIEQNPILYLPDYAKTLNNLAMLHQLKHEDTKALEVFEKVLQIYLDLSKNNPYTHLFGLGTTYNNMASLLVKLNKLEMASHYFEEALKIYHQLAKENLQSYFTYLTMSLSNLSIFYQSAIPQRKKSIEYAVMAIIILLPYVERVPFTSEYYANALKVLNNWGLTDEEIDKLIQEKMSDEL